MKRIVFISDTHTMHEDLVLPQGDILIHAGDFTGRGQPHEVGDFFRWMERQAENFEHIIFIAGNHDRSFEYKSTWVSYAISKLPKNIHYLEDSEVIIDGIKFYGSPWQPEFHNWAFNLPRGKELEEKWNMIPHDTDVLITHGPPATILDYTERDRVNVGCEELLKRLSEVKPKIHVFGHIHEGYGYKEHYGTTFINASTCTLRYNPTNPPVVVDFDGKSVEFVTS
jgi:Icc-related predicted phosphoesterase